MSSESAVDALLQQLRAAARTPVVAQIGGFRPPEGLTSRFGGPLRLPPDRWPRIDGRYAMPLLQIVVAELPDVPAWAGNATLVQVLVGARLPTPTPAKNGDGFWVLIDQGTPDDDDFEPKDDDAVGLVKGFPIRWSLGEPEHPVWEDTDDYVDLNLVSDAVEEADGFTFLEQLNHVHRTKVGGHPSYCQGPVRGPGQFAFQIDSEEKPGFIVGDSGSMFFFVDDAGRWSMSWDCY